MKKTLEQKAYEHILYRIQKGDYTPGTHLKEKEFAEQLQTSRTPIRRAFSRLEAEGILKHDSHCGSTVQNFQVSMQDYISMLEIRAQFFSMSIQKAKRKQIPFDIPALSQIIDHVYLAISEDNPKAYYEGLSQFHRLLLVPAQNTLVNKIMETVEEKFQIGGSLVLIYDRWRPIRYKMVKNAERIVQHLAQNHYEEALCIFEESIKELIQFMIL
ncbi:GntR family transcriptional regulator [Bacillus thuringiensis]|nr:GntR family transcriptional regulator [Bacillus thuringiensis]